MINFLKYKHIYFIISGLLIAASIASLTLWRLRPSIDFVGGTLIEIKNEKGKIKNSKIKEILNKNKVEIINEKKTEESAIFLKTEFINQNKAKKIRSEINRLEDHTLERFETVGPTLGKELLKKTIAAAALAILGMFLYIGWAFKNIRIGLSAILALLHDTIILVGSFSVLGRFYNVEVDALFVTAVLTTMSFSVHDTVVVFNKIREKGSAVKKDQLEDNANSALTETMVRSINNSLTIAFMLLALVLLGGESIRWFTIALLIGTILGTYSSPFIAVPILTILYKKKIQAKS